MIGRAGCVRGAYGGHDDLKAHARLARVNREELGLSKFLPGYPLILVLFRAGIVPLTVPAIATFLQVTILLTKLLTRI
jgi:hypothetical protein